MNKWQKMFAVAAAVVTATAWADYTVNVHINGAEQPSLTFGEASEASLFPAPPTSVAFGVADVVIDHEVTGNESAWYARLSEDIRTTVSTRAVTSGNKWLILSNTKSRLTFKAADDADIPSGLKLAYIDAKGNVKTADLSGIADEEVTVSVPAGSQITVGLLSASNPEADLLTPANEEAIVARKNADTKIYEGTHAIPAGLATAGTVYVDLVKGETTVAVPGDRDEAQADWLLEIPEGATYAWQNAGHTQLAITLDNPAAANNLKMTAAKGSAKPVITYLKAAADGDVSLALGNLLQKKGTLDFDNNGDGIPDNNDVMYFFNFVANGCDPDLTADDIIGYTDEEATPERRQIAIDTLKDSIDELCLGGWESPTNNDVMFMFNFVANGCDPDLTADDIVGYTDEEATPERRQAALETMKDYIE